MEAIQPQFIIQCASVYLGPRTECRVKSPERALRFNSRCAADRRAKQLRGVGRFPLPWTVVPAPPGDESDDEISVFVCAGR
jgi:hypothetical protein